MNTYDYPVVYDNGNIVKANDNDKNLYTKTLTYNILNSHNIKKDDDLLHIRFDSLTSHDITYVNIIQTAKASGLKKFDMPYVLTNCHNSLCAVGGTINEDDHRFALSAAKKYGGIFVPTNYAVIHSYNREMMTGSNRMILGSDSHTRYGALGTMGIGEGGGELVKQLVGKTYDISYPEVVLVYVHGNVKKGVGPHDVALDLIASTYASGFVKNCVMEFVGPGINNLSQDYRNGIDVMTTEATCLSSIWETDEVTQKYYEVHNRLNDYKKLKVEKAYYDKYIDLDLDKVECMIALPSHPSYAISINELKKDPKKYFKQAQDRQNEQLKSKQKMDLLSKIDKDNNIHVDQAIIAGCSGGIYENIVYASKVLKGHDIGNDKFRLSVYPDSLPSNLELVKNGYVSDLLESGVIYREAFCGPCFGAGDTPANNELSIRHTTRNFPNREGSKPNEDQISMVCLMDARSIAATALNKGILTAASDLDLDIEVESSGFNTRLYENGVYNGFNSGNENIELEYGPNIKDWPNILELKDNILIKVISHIDDPVTTTDELIPSGETSSYRSNPLRLAQFTLSRRDPEYVNKAKKLMEDKLDNKVIELLKKNNFDVESEIGSAIYANKPGDGSAREQAASCQRVLGGLANFAKEYATKRYRSNLINWGILPFIVEDSDLFKEGTYVYIKNIREAILNDNDVEAYVLDDKVQKVSLKLGKLSKEEKQILLDGCLINYYRNN